jgi:hypothetical protein
MLADGLWSMKDEDAGQLMAVADLVCAQQSIRKIAHDLGPPPPPSIASRNKRSPAACCNRRISMTKKAYYERKRDEVVTALLAAAYWNPPHCTLPRPDCPKNLARWAYEYRWRPESMGPKRIALIGKLLGILVWAKPTITEVRPDYTPSKTIVTWRPWGTPVA